jgi:hypothetical protein
MHWSGPQHGPEQKPDRMVLLIPPEETWWRAPDRTRTFDAGEQR